MKSIQRIILLAIILASTLLPLSAQNSISDARAVSFSIRYYDKKVYHISGGQDDPVYVLMTVTNNGPGTFRFKLAEDRVFSVDFDVRNMKNRAVDLSEGLIKRRSQKQQVFFREISVETGESFSFVEDVRDFASLAEPGSFVMQARIFPELFRPDAVGIERTGAAPEAVPSILSNRLTLNLRPPHVRDDNGVLVMMDEQTNLPLLPESLSPDRVVEYFLIARQNEHWEKFFLYLDLEALYTRDASRKRQYARETAETRRATLMEYRQNIQSGFTDREFSNVPINFTIEKTEYNANVGRVYVAQQFKPGSYIEQMRYVYTLNRKDAIWTIVDYAVYNFAANQAP
ncbi:hypothetical protein FACS1894200_06610 [Spirochaetia bacterium]|nr:hypothetical protein FACS1894200_06610 [Spirochaetia bacterium]